MTIDTSSVPKCENYPDRLVCPICWESIAEEEVGLAGTDPCNCIYHYYCINNWINNPIKNNNSIARDCCPVCRKACLWEFYKYLEKEPPNYHKFWTGKSKK